MADFLSPPAILCAGSSSLAPFMADEAVLSVPGLGKMDYTLKHYMAYASKLQDKVKELNASGEGNEGWVDISAEDFALVQRILGF